MSADHETFSSVPFPRNRLLMVDGGRLGRRRHTIHGLVEFDITQARNAIRRRQAVSGESFSFSAFFLVCLGQAIAADPRVHAYRGGRNRLIVFDEVDVNMLFEVEVDGHKTIRPHILRGVNKKNAAELHEEIRAFQGQAASGQEVRFIEWFVRLPGFVRRPLLRFLLQEPRRRKRYYGTVLVSSIGMFGEGSGWGIPVSNHTLQLTLGGIGRKPGVVEQRIEVREFMSVTISFDHDVIDGAPAVRFIQRLKELVEQGYGLED